MTCRSFQRTKRGRRRQAQGLFSSNRSWRVSALWRPPLLSYRYNRTESNSCPSRGKDGGYAQASGDAGPPSGRNQDMTNNKNIPSRPNHCRPHRPSTNVPSHPGANTIALHLRYHGRGSGHSTRPQRSWVSCHIQLPRRRGKHNPLISAGEAQYFASMGEATTCGVPQGFRVTHPRSMERSVRDPVLCPTNTREWEDLCLCKGHLRWLPFRNSGGESRLAHPGRGQCPPSSRYGRPSSTPHSRAYAPNNREHKTRQGLRNPGFPFPPLPGPPDDGIPFPSAGNCVAHDAHK